MATTAVIIENKSMPSKKPKNGLQRKWNAYAGLVTVVREVLIPVSSGIAETYEPTEKGLL